MSSFVHPDTRNNLNTGTSPVESNQDGQGAGADEEQGEAEGTRFIQPSEKKGKGGYYCCLQLSDERM